MRVLFFEAGSPCQQVQVEWEPGSSFRVANPAFSDTVFGADHLRRTLVEALSRSTDHQGLPYAKTYRSGGLWLLLSSTGRDAWLEEPPGHLAFEGSMTALPYVFCLSSLSDVPGSIQGILRLRVFRRLEVSCSVPNAF